MKFKTLGVASSLAIVAGLSAPAYAQNEPAAAQAASTEDEDGRNDVITVTAQFREQNLQDTPIAITAMNSEMLEARGQTNIAQVAANAASLGAEVMTAHDPAQLAEALADARRRRGGPLVIVVETDPEPAVPGYDSWWDVPVAEVSESARVRAARERYEADLRRERAFVS